MAYIETREHDGAVTSYRVRWRDGGKYGTKKTKVIAAGVFEHPDRVAAQLVAAIGLAGERWPGDDLLRAAGLGVFASDAVPAGAGPGAVTVAGMVGAYIDMLCRSINAPEQRTTDEYRAYLRLYVAPRAIGARDVTDPALTFADVDAWQHELMCTVAPGGRAPLSKNSVLKVRSSLLAPAFAWACGPRGRMRSAPDPMAHSEAPTKTDPAPKDRLFTPDEYLMFTTAAYTVDCSWADMVSTAAATGIRNSEYRPLRAEHVDTRRRVLYVATRATQGGRVIARTKNGTPVREVPVPDHILERCLAPRLRARGPLFTGPAGAAWAYATEADRWTALRRELAGAGLPRHITPHSLRHGYVTWLRTQGVDAGKVEAAVGHRKKSVTDGYDQLTDVDLGRIRDAMATLVRLPG